MKQHPEYNIEDFYCLRIPAQPVESIMQLNEQIKNLDMADHDAVVHTIEQIFAEPLFQKAIFISSKELYARFCAFRQKGYKDKNKTRRFLIALYKYFSRMSHRCTPYGIFAGLSTGQVSSEPTRFEFADQKFRPVFQFNIQSIVTLVRQLNAVDPALLQHLRYEVNNTLYIMGDKIYFVEKIDRDGRVVSNLTSITLNIHIQRILDKARQGATIPDLIACIELPNVELHQKVGFIQSLIKSQVLISELWPSVSTDDFMDDFLQKVKDKSFTNEQIETLYLLDTQFRQVDGLDGIDQVKQFLQEEKDREMLREKDLFKVDLFYNTKANQINRDVIKEICQTSYELMEVTAPITANTLETFMEKFSARYEMKEVPLVEALDPNYGIGYGLVVGGGVADYTPLVDNVPVAPPKGEGPQFMAKFDQLRRNAVKKWHQKGQKIVKINKEIKEWRQEKSTAFDNRTRSSTYIFGSLTANSPEALDQCDFRFRPVQMHSPYAIRLLSRFLHGDQQLKENIQSLAKKEQEVNPDLVLAEVLYIPDGKYANISLYPNLRSHEIPYLSASKLDESKQIDINDLYVSVRNSRVVLRSKKLNKEIVPYLSNTFDAGFGNPIFQFLSAISYQNMSHGFIWDWGTTYYDEPFLPRVEYKNFVLSRARWFIKKTKVNYKDVAAASAFIKKMVVERDMPRYMILPAGDNELLLDMENPVCQYILGKEISKKDLFLYEYLKSPDRCFIEQDGKHFTNEILIPMTTEKPMYPAYNFEKPVMAQDEVQRVFPPGSEWLYIKVYAGSKIIENVLTGVVKDFADRLHKEGVIDRWFFLRFADPDYHLRVRFHRSAKADNPEWYTILEQFQQAVKALIPRPNATKIVVDSYRREVERYGVDTMDLSEKIFFADSKAIVNFLDLIYGNQGEELRWKFGLVCVDQMLDDFGLSLKEKKRLMHNLSRYFFAEFNQHSDDKGKALSKAMKDKYRAKRDDVFAMLDPEKRDPELAEGYECFEERSQAIRPLIPEVGEVTQIFWDDFVASHIHMAMNRLFLVNQRKHELIIYDFLNQYYESVIAQQKVRINEYAN